VCPIFFSPIDTVVSLFFLVHSPIYFSYLDFPTSAHCSSYLSAFRLLVFCPTPRVAPSLVLADAGVRRCRYPLHYVFPMSYGFNFFPGVRNRSTLSICSSFRSRRLGDRPQALIRSSFPLSLISLLHLIAPPSSLMAFQGPLVVVCPFRYRTPVCRSF